MERPLITVVGSSNTDLVVRAPYIPAPGETLLGSDFQRLPGGKGANQAVAARRVGADVHFVGCLGDDDLGDTTATILAAEGLRLDYLRRAPGVASGVALIVVAASGENSIVVASGANMRLASDDIDRAAPAIEVSRMVIAQLEIPLATVQRAFDLARAAHVTTLLNSAPAQPLPDELLALVDILVCNETEAAMLTETPVASPQEALAAARALQARGPRFVIVTLGADGCVLADGDTLTYIPAFAVPVVDSTAAGDAFIGALATRLAAGDPPEVAARYATAAAALSVAAPGAQPSLPTGAAVTAFLARQALP